MMLKKKGFPEVGELLLCTVTKIFGHGVFLNIEDYNISGMIHISEISPGRIRNLRDYVVEGKKIVCVVLRINREKGHVDLSLRRVNDGQKRRKLDEIKQEQKSEKIAENIAKELHKDKKQFYEEITEKIFKSYKNLNSCFSEVVNNNSLLDELGLKKEYSEKLTAVIKERMKPPKAVISGKLSLKIYAADGIDIIKQALEKVETIGKENIVVKYAGGGAFNIIITTDDFKQAEKILKDITDSVTVFMEKKDGISEFVRKEIKK